MSLRALIRPIVLATSLLTGLGPSVDALAHGVAHAHEAEYRAAVAQPTSHAHPQQDSQRRHGEQHGEPHPQGEGHQHDEPHEHDEHHQPDGNLQPHTAPPHSVELLLPEVTRDDHHHSHVHAIVDAGLKSRADLAPFLAAGASDLTLSMRVGGKHETPRTGSPAPPPAQRSTSASPRAPPSR